jgi:hypothetical protein
MNNELINPISGEIISDPSLQDILNIQIEIKRMEEKLDAAKETVKQLASIVMVDDKYVVGDYTISRRTRSNANYPNTVLGELKNRTVMDLMDAGAVKLLAGKVDAYVRDGLLKGDVETADLRKLAEVRYETPISFIEVRKNKENK